MSVVYHFVNVIYIYIISVQVSEKIDKKFNIYIYMVTFIHPNDKYIQIDGIEENERETECIL